MYVSYCPIEKSSSSPGSVFFPLYPRLSTGKSISVFTPSPNSANVFLYVLNASSSIISGASYE